MASHPTRFKLGGEIDFLYLECRSALPAAGGVLYLSHRPGGGERERLLQRLPRLREDEPLQDVAVGGDLHPKHVDITVAQLEVLDCRVVYCSGDFNREEKGLPER